VLGAVVRLRYKKPLCDVTALDTDQWARLSNPGPRKEQPIGAILAKCRKNYCPLRVPVVDKLSKK
jgi:hypothetical protein